jgi:hypothetical protein
MTRELIPLHPYRLPAHHSLMLNEDDAAIFMNGYLSLWHPMALRGASGPPRIASHYDHETPSPGHVYAVPESPTLFLPDDWEQRVVQAGAVCFKATTDRAGTQARLLRALVPSAVATEVQVATGLAEAHDEGTNLYQAIGLGYAVLQAVYEAMDHLPQLVEEDFWRDITQALEATEAAARRQHLQAAAHRLREAREVLYPNVVHFAELMLLEAQPTLTLPPWLLGTRLPINLIGSARHDENMEQHAPEQLACIRQRVESEELEVCGGPLVEREDALLPIESQLWNLRQGLARYQKVLGHEPRVFARRRFGASPQLPSLLHAAGLYKAILLQFDESVVPQYRSAVIEWTATDGKRLETFTRKPQLADRASTYFHLAHHLAQTMLHDMAATFVLLHAEKPAASFHADWLALHELAPVFGQHVTLTRFFAEVLAGEYPPALAADQFHSAYLDDLTTRKQERPVSRFAEHARGRRAVENACTLAGLHRGVSRAASSAELQAQCAQAEDVFERGEAEADALVHAAEQAALAKLAERLLARAAGETPGHLLLNTCSFARRVAVELKGVRTPLPAPARATQIEGDTARVVVGLPPLGFAWLPNGVTAGTKVAMPRGQPVEGRLLHNEFYEAEIDEQTGGLRALRDPRRGGSRLAMQLVYVPGGSARVLDVRTTSTGPALGEIVTKGELLDGFNNLLAAFRQRFRCWWGRPILEVRIDLEPIGPLDGYPWHNCFAARFAWRDEKAFLYRGVNQLRCQTTHNRPESPEFFEIHATSKGPAFLAAAERTAILTGGLPFLQRQQGRMLDVILIPPGETATTFELGLVLDQEDPAQAAQDFITPVSVLPVAKGPPHVGASAWLFYVDAPNLLLTSVRPAADGRDAVVARLVESRGVATPAELHCVRPPTRAVLVDEKGTELGEATVNGSAVSLYLSAGEMQLVRVEFA